MVLPRLLTYLPAHCCALLGCCLAGSTVPCCYCAKPRQLSWCRFLIEEVVSAPPSTEPICLNAIPASPMQAGRPAPSHLQMSGALCAWQLRHGTTFLLAISLSTVPCSTSYCIAVMLLRGLSMHSFCWVAHPHDFFTGQKPQARLQRHYVCDQGACIYLPHSSSYRQH